MTRVIWIWVLVAMLFCFNLGFNIHTVNAGYPPDQIYRWMQNADPGFGGRALGGSYGYGSPRGGAGFDRWGYQYFNPLNGPNMPARGQGYSLNYYDYTQGAPFPRGSGNGGDGYSFGTYQPGSLGLYGWYGYGFGNPFRN